MRTRRTKRIDERPKTTPAAKPSQPKPEMLEGAGNRATWHALSGGVRSRMESNLGTSFANVKVHTGAEAAREADHANARAFTVGENIVMGRGEFQPGTPAGDVLLAHELAHVAQQRGPDSGAAESDLERQADSSAAAALLGGKAKSAASSGLRLQRCPPAPKQADEVSLGFWTPKGVMNILSKSGDAAVVKGVVDAGYTFGSFTTAYDTWENPDHTQVEEEVTGLLGNTDRQNKIIRIREDLSNERATSVLVHEAYHATHGPPQSQNAYLEQEIQARVTAEQFHIKQGWRESGPGYRTADGQVNEAKIRQEITGSSHYNPQTRKRIKRRWEGDRKVEGWKVP